VKKERGSKERGGICLTPETWKEARSLAERGGISVSSVIEIALRQAFRQGLTISEDLKGASHEV